jgi:hypothetical protein
MRTLLLDLRADDAQAPPLEPLPSVRANVMDAFRAQRQPQWRIWLNSIGGVLVPGELPRLWRPALAFASLALLIVVAVWFIRGDGLARGDALAELKQKEAPVQRTAEPETTLDTATENATSTGAAATGKVVLTEVPDLNDAPAEAEITMDVSDAERAANAELVAEPAEDLAEERSVVSANDNVKQEADAVSLYTTAPASGRVIQLEELSRNQTVANTEVRVASSKSRAKVADTPLNGRSLAQDRELASLLAAGW